MDPKEARTLIRESVRPCPNCGGGIVIKVEGPDEAADHFRALIETCATVTLATPEDLEVALRSGRSLLEPPE